METKELCNISISPLVTVPFAIQWSPDNQISIITEKGVHIFELVPSPMSPNTTIKFARSFIYPSDTLPAYAFLDKIESLIWNSNRKEIYSLLMEETVTPKLDSVSDTTLRIEKVAWSPKNLVSPSQCILSILTVAGTVELLHKVSNEWLSICNVSSLRLSIVENGINSKLNKCKELNNQYAVITESMRQTQACSMTWSKLFKIEETSFAYFSVAYRSGEILIWKIPRISNFTDCLKPMLVGSIDLNTSVKINLLCWVTFNTNDHLLVVGYFDGQICGIKLSCSDDNLQLASIEKYVDSDRTVINYLHIIFQDKSNIKILAAKGSFLLLLCINSTGTLNSMQHLQVEGLNITGISSIGAQLFLVTTQNSHIFVVDTQSDDLISIDIKNHLPQKCVQYLGLAHSPNKVMFVNVTSPNMIYDHLVMREPSVIHIFALKGTMWDPLSIINNSTNLKNVWDCMEMLRLKAITAEDPSAVLPSIPENLESLLLYDLQVSLWVTVMINVCTTKKPMPNMDYIRESKITRAFPLIFIDSACTYLACLMKKSTLSINQKLSVSLLRKHLEMYLANEEENNRGVIYQRIQEMLNATTSYSNEIEKCNLCGEVREELWNVKSCSQGHKLSRCIMTLLQIDLFEYRICPICGQIFHPCLEEVYEEPQCQYCDVPILHNPYAFNIEKSELYGRNLSQLRINVVESSKESDDFEEPPVKQRKNKWDTSHTYSVIVNDDDDESGRITEKWEKF